ncbi:hypothetical protein ACD591_02820 [Rufibacter glacialis]|uniref:GMT-like wHTH domain-containing protein n=1 Tax=Rufibacter glacialis TaxID=1259555 RepID=A0A5M8QNQ4_9BACT|nr:hypothetical protein [Rufibacter glacialis]KAA6435812.1 hypothetical protein FOE74_07725 [Rufibacter glacialis]
MLTERKEDIVAKTDPKDFFRQRRSAAQVKAEFLVAFFPVWCEMLLSEKDPEAKVLYLDANAGLGLEEEGAQPVSFQVLKSIFARSGGRLNLNKAVHPFLYEANKALAATLPQLATELPFYADLQQEPQFLHLPEAQLALQEQEAAADAVFLSLDPFGNKFSQELWARALGQDHTHFLLQFEFKRLTAALSSQKPDHPLHTLLGSRLPALKALLAKTSHAAKKETYVLKAFAESLLEKGYQATRFRINVPGKDQSNHHVWFVSRHELAHTRFKEVVLPYSDVQEDGVPLLGANLKAVRLLVPEYSKYLEFSLVNLIEDLLQNTAVYNSMALEKIYEKHNVGKNYSKANYQTAFEKLKEQGKITLLNPKTGQVVYKLTFATRIKFNP